MKLSRRQDILDRALKTEQMKSLRGKTRGVASGEHFGRKVMDAEEVERHMS